MLAAYFLVILFIFDTLFSLTHIAYNALFPEIAPAVHDRVDLSVVREILGTIALLASYILAPILAEKVGYIWMGAIMGTLVAVGYLVSMIGVKEVAVGAGEVQLGLGDSLRTVLSSIPFRWFLGANIAKEYIWLALGAMLPFWRKYVLAIQGPVNVSGVQLSEGDSEAILLGLAILISGSGPQDRELVLSMVSYWAEIGVTVESREMERAACTITEAEVARAKAQMKATLLMALESSSARAEQMARHIMVYGRPLSLSEIVAKIEAVTVESTQDAARARLARSRPAIAGLGPGRGLELAAEIVGNFARAAA